MRLKLSAITLSVLLILSLFAATPVVAQEDGSEESIPEKHTKYIVNHNVETGESTVQLEVRLSEPSKYADWNLSWSIPESSTIQEVRTSSSDTVEQERNGNEVKFVEKDGPARNSETFYITYTTDNFVTTTEKYGVNQHEILASGLPDEDSYLEVTFEDEEIANAVRYSDHSLKIEENKFTASGTGPPSFYINTIDKSPDVKTDDYVVYGQDISENVLDNSYAISTIATGFVPQYKHVPLIILSEDQYDDEFDTVSEGQFEAGVIYLSDEVTSSERRLLPILTHEYTHAVTQRVEPTSPSRWFTEGASQYTESIALEKVGRPQNEIDYETFQDYQSNEKTWIYTSSWDSYSDEEREFAYDHSELLFKYREAQTESNFMHQLYKDMASDSITVDRETTPTVLYGDDWNGKVCERSTSSEQEQCVNETMDTPPELEQPNEYSTPFDEPQSQDIVYEEADYSSGEIGGNSPIQILDKIIDAIEGFVESDLVQSIIEQMNKLLKTVF